MWNNIKIADNNNYLDDKVWKCRTKSAAQDIKISIWKTYIFENLKVSIQIIFFITFINFTDKLSIEKAYNEQIKYPELLNNNKISKDIIIKIYHILGEKIIKCIYNYWRNNSLGNNINDKGYSSIGIEKNEIVGINETIYWMFSMSDRFNKDVRIYYVINNRNKNNILPIIKENILKKSENKNDMDFDNNYLINAKYIKIHLLLIK